MRTVEITPSNKDCNSKQKLMSSYCILLNISHTSAWKSEASPVSLTLQPYVIFWPFWQQLLLFLWNSGNSIQESLFSILKVLAAQFGTPFVICSPLALISDFITRDSYFSLQELILCFSLKRTYFVAMSLCLNFHSLTCLIVFCLAGNTLPVHFDTYCSWCMYP